MLTRNAVGNLIKKYSAVLQKCAWLNACVLTGAVVCGGLAPVNVAYAVDTQPLTTAWEDTTQDKHGMTANHIGIISGSGLIKDFVINGDGKTITGQEQEYGHEYILRIGSMWDDEAALLTLSNVTIEEFNRDTSNTSGSALIGVSESTARCVINENVTIQNNNLLAGAGVFNRGILEINGTNENVKFLNNTATGDDDYSAGGAIKNEGIANISGTLFQGNSAEHSGGAIDNRDTLIVQNSSFLGNTSDNRGGAIANYYDSTEDLLVIVQDSIFTGNSASTEGGAIANYLEFLKIIATNDSATGVQFTGNKAKGVSNAIYNYGGDVFLYAERNGTITFEDGIKTLYINSDYLGNIVIGGADSITDASGAVVVKNYDGTVVMNNIISGNSAVTLKDGTFKLGLYEADGKTTNFADTLDLVLNGGTVDMQDDEEQTPPSAVQQRQMSAMLRASQTPTSVKPQRQTLDTVKLGGDVTMKLDVVLDNENSAMDGFDAGNYAGSGNLTLNLEIFEKTDEPVEKMAVPFTTGGAFTTQNDVVLEGDSLTDGVYKGAVYEYDVAYLVADEAADGMTVGDAYITFEREAFNPETATADVATTSLFIFQDEIYTRLFRSHNATKDRIEARDEGAAFMSVFGGKEQLDFENFGYDVNLKTAGTIVGYEGNSLDLGSDAEVFLSMYGAYVRGESDFADSELIQDSYYLGAGANFHKGDAYLLSTALMSVTNNEVRDTGSDSFISYTAGLGLEGGYVFDLGEGFTLQPNVFASFTYINSEAWETGRGAAISDGDFYELRLSPGLRLDKEFTDMVTGYAFGRYVHIEVDGTTMTANDITLPDISLKPYAEYGVGFSSEWDSLTFFAEGLCRNGGREGWEGQVGFKYTW